LASYTVISLRLTPFFVILQRVRLNDDDVLIPETDFLSVVLNTVKKSFSIFPSPAGMPLAKLSLGGNNDVIYKLFPPRESLVSDIPAVDGNIEKLFLRCRWSKDS
jgi:hypothetical protein